MGNRLSKKVFDPSGDILTADYYIRDAQGNVMAVYKLNIDPQTQTTNWTVVERNIYGSDRLGVYAYPDTVYPAQGAPTADYTSVWRGYRKYELKNHLGNVVTVVSGHKIPVQDGASIGHFTAQIDAAYDYSPFGVTRMEFGEYRWGFQGQERDDEIKSSGNSINYKYRVHDPRLGRFLSLDPLAPEYPHNSPYAFSENRVVDGVELEGLEWKKQTETLNSGKTKITLTLDIQVVNITGQVSPEARISNTEIVQFTSAILQTFENSIEANSNSNTEYDFKYNISYSSEIKEGGYTSADAPFQLTFSDMIMEDGVVGQGQANIGETQNNNVRVVPLEAYEGYLTGERLPLANIAKTGAHEIGHSGGLNHIKDETEEIREAVGGEPNLMRQGGTNTDLVKEQNDKIVNNVPEKE